MPTVTLRVKVRPNAGSSSLERLPDGSWVAKLKSPPVDGKANRELIALVANHFHCPKAAVRIKVGASGRVKLLEVESA
jgi:uncharacterized protein